MTFDRYPITIGKISPTFEFVSEGVKGRVHKLVIYNRTDWENVFNLGFGDKDEDTGEIDDEAVTNNGDSKKVLATVASTLYSFTDQNPDAAVFVTGSCKVRTRLYRIGICNNIELIENDFEVFGYIGGNWQVFEKQVDYESFLVIRKKKINL